VADRLGEGVNYTNRKIVLEYIKKVFARELRKEQTPEEAIVWEQLRNRKFMDLKFRRQHVIEGFVVDFYCHQLRLAIEIDGAVHNKQKDYDALRQMLIESKDIRFIRVTNDEVHQDINILLKRIKENLR
jgi:very-short-patch-repair endonuclease